MLVRTMRGVALSGIAALRRKGVAPGWRIGVGVVREVARPRLVTAREEREEDRETGPPGTDS